MNKHQDKVIEFINVCFSYGVNEILHNVDFDICRNDFVAVVGPNGGGKTTLIKLILGLIKPQRGTVKLLGDLPKLTRYRVGYVPQIVHYDLRFPVTVRDVVRMGRIGMHGFGAFKKNDDLAVQNALNKTYSLEFIDQSFADLSGGERQRVMLAQALVADPDILLLDEPTANIDSSVEKELFELFRKLNESITFVLVSHNLNVVTKHANKILCINRTTQIRSLENMTTSQIHSAEGAELALLLHNDQCPVHDSSKTMKFEHKAEMHESDQ
ncbi:metal ABC transporter ATP-binding protein [bacterium]|nr:metal ABC transporter ATP-binding protein [bacterium]